MARKRISATPEITVIQDDLLIPVVDTSEQPDSSGRHIKATNLLKTINSDTITATDITTTSLTATDITTTSLTADSISINGQNLTVQNLYETINGDTGSTTANNPTDALTISGGDGLVTAVTDDSLLISRIVALQSEAETGTDNVKGMTPLRVAQALASQILNVLSSLVITAKNYFGTKLILTPANGETAIVNVLTASTYTITPSGASFTLDLTNIPDSPDEWRVTIYAINWDGVAITLPSLSVTTKGNGLVFTSGGGKDRLVIRGDSGSSGEKEYYNLPGDMK